MARASEAEIRASLDRIEDVLGNHPGGLSRSEINDALEERQGERLHERTLNRRLKRLAQEGRVLAEGEARARRYVLIPVTERRAGEVPDVQRAPADQSSEDVSIPVSEEGARLRRRVRRPLHEREPCGYDRAFLDAYVPGETWYLSEGMRTELRAAGQTPDRERPAGTYARDILGQLLIDLSWASSRLEGNTYSRLDTQNLLELGMRAEGKSREEAQMILNHRNAIRLLVEHADSMRYDRRSILGLHAALAENLVANPGDEGALRRRAVNVSGTVYTPTAIPQVLEECLEQILVRAGAIPDPFEQAFFVLVHIPYLQPFIDVNKRTSRLAANIPFVRENLCPLSFVDVPERTYVDGTLAVYEERRVELLRDLFVWAYRRSCEQYRVVRESLGEPDAVRFKYRDVLVDLVRETVRERRPVVRRHLREWASSHGVEAADLDAFAERAMELLLNLTEGAARRSGLDPREVDGWRRAIASGARM